MPSDSTSTPIKIIFTWRCMCGATNKTTSTEEHQVRELPAREICREPSWYGEVCETCGEKAERKTGLLSVEVEEGVKG
jgi:hypothetical protein